MTVDLTLGIAPHDALYTPDPHERRALLRHMEEVGLDHVTVGDHISFHDGGGYDGFVGASTVLAASDSLSVLMGVYLAGLRHPMATARSLATLNQTAPGRLVLGVGVAGEDRSEVVNVGVDPSTRGRRVDETLGLLRQLATGGAVDHEGEFFSLSGARIRPAQEPRVPLVIGGGGDVAVRRTAEHGDGWLGMWCSARRYAATQERIVDECARRARPAPTFAGFMVWVGLGADGGRARSRLAEPLTSFYKLPADRFRNVTAAGTPEDVAAFLTPYVEGGARTITLVPVAETMREAVELAGEVRRLLRADTATSSSRHRRTGPAQSRLRG